MKKPTWDLSEVDESPRMATDWALDEIAELELNDTVKKFVYPSWETSWLGWYEIERRGGIYYAVCTAELARWEDRGHGVPCREPRYQVSHPREARCRNLIEVHILRRCGDNPITIPKSPKECPF